MLLVAGGGRANTAPSIVSISDTSGLHWSRYAQQGAASPGTPTYADAELWYAPYDGVDPITTTVTVTVTGTEMEVAVIPLTGVNLEGIFDPGAAVPLPNYAYTDTANSYAALVAQLTTSKATTFIGVVGAGNIANASPALPSGIAEIGYVQQGGSLGIPLSGMAVMGQQQPAIITSPQTVTFDSDWNATGGAGAAIAFAVAGYVSPTVPNVVNTAIALAEQTIENAGFDVGAVTTAHSGIIIAGNVISQSPAAGAAAAFGTPVALVVSSGLPPLTVPDLFEMTQADSVALLLSLGFLVGAVGSQPSNLIPAGTVMLQNPSAGTVLPPGNFVSFVLSTGEPATSSLFDFEATVISQYANSPTIMQLVANLNQYIDQSANFANFYNYIWNIDSAVGFGLDIWGVIVGVSRLLNIPTGVEYAGFYQAGESQPDQDWTPAGSSQPPYNNPPVGGAMYTGYNATTAYLLPDDAYRQLILAKAFANICTTTAPALNRILQNLYGAGTAYVLNTGRMAISYNLTFTPTPIQLAILEQSGVIPTPPGVAVTINTNV